MAEAAIIDGRAIATGLRERIAEAAARSMSAAKPAPVPLPGSPPSNIA